MATKRTAKLPYRWSNGTYHSRPEKKPASKKPPMTSFKPAPVKQGGPKLTGPARPTLKPLAPATPVQPLDPSVVNQQGIGQRDVALSDLNATWQQGNLDQQYGFGAGGAANPYSHAAIMQENLKRQVLGTQSGFASQGQYNSGAYGRAQNENQRNYDINYDQARRAYDQASGNLQFGRLQTYANAGTAVTGEKFNALLKALGGL